MDRHQLEFYLDGDGGYPGSGFSEPVWKTILSTNHIDDAESESEQEWADNRLLRRHERLSALREIYNRADENNTALLDAAMPLGVRDVIKAYHHHRITPAQAIEALHHVLDVLPFMLVLAFQSGAGRSIVEYAHANNGAIRALAVKLLGEKQEE